jgi:hypothetical protein
MKIIGFSQLRNELEKGNLENWFRCMLSICDYIYIYDQNSTDGSLDYYSKFDNTVVIKSNTNRFKEEIICKGKLLEKIKKEHPDTDWIFWMDGDTLLDGRLLKDNGSGFKSLCGSLKNDDYQGYLFGHKNLWRSDIYWRKDNFYNWLDENGVCALWRFTKDLFFSKVSGLHGREYPNNITKIRMLEFKLIHRGFATDYQIITKFNVYKLYGQSGPDLERLLDESTLMVEKLPEGILPEWFDIVDTTLPTKKQRIRKIYDESR